MNLSNVWFLRSPRVIFSPSVRAVQRMAWQLPGQAIDSAFDALYARLFAVGGKPTPSTIPSVTPPVAPPPAPPKHLPPVQPQVVTPPAPAPAPQQPQIDRAALHRHVKELLSKSDSSLIKRSVLREQLSAQHGYDFTSLANDQLLKAVAEQVVEELNEEEEEEEGHNMGDSELPDEAKPALKDTIPPPPSIPPPFPAKPAPKSKGTTSDSGEKRPRAPADATESSRCSLCIRKHRSCDRKRPCHSCVQLNVADQCTDDAKRPRTADADKRSKKNHSPSTEALDDVVVEISEPSDASDGAKEKVSAKPKPAAKQASVKKEGKPTLESQRKRKAETPEAKEKAVARKASPKHAALRTDGAAPKEWRGPPRLTHLKPDTDPCTQLLVYRPNPARGRRLLRFTWRGSLYTTEALPALQASVISKTLAMLWVLHAELKRNAKLRIATVPSGAVFLRRNTIRRPAPAYLDGDTEFYTSPSRVNRLKRR